MRETLLCTLLTLVGSSAAFSAPPTVQWLFPAGARRGTSIELQAGPTFPRWPAKLHTVGKGIEYTPGKSAGSGTLKIAADATPGIHWLRFHDADGGAASRPFLVGNLPEINETEPNDDFRKPQVIPSLPVTINGRLGRGGDVDSFAVDLKKGQTLVASLEAHRTLGSPMDAVMQLTSADGFVLADNHDEHDLDPQIVRTVPADGRYVVRIYAFPSQPDSSIAFSGSDSYIYRLTLTTGGFAEYAWPLAVARSAPGAVELVGWNLPTPGPKIAVPATDEDTAVVWKDDVANPVSVRLEPHPTVVETTPDGARPPQALTLPTTVTGRLGKPGEADVYRFTAKKGQSLVVAVESHVLGFPLDAVLSVSDAAGKKLAEADDNGGNHDPELTFTAPADGDYQAEVRDRFEHGGPRYAYLLRVAPPRPDFALTVTADQFTLTPAKPLDVVVTVARRQGMNQPISIVAEGLPDGIIAPPATCAAGATTVTLKLTAKSAGPTGAFRIVGKAAGLTRAARGPVVGTTHATPHLWVTATK